ncbi:MAG: hypothetical protein ACI84K_000140 [Pseudohongiellaceae bacterium]|jgi:hypothetical protein
MARMLEAKTNLKFSESLEIASKNVIIIDITSSKVIQLYKFYRRYQKRM